MRKLRSVVALCVWFFAACRQNTTLSNQAGSGSAPPIAKPPTACVYVGDKQITCLDAAAVAAWPRLDTLLPSEARRIGTWKSIAVQTRKGRGTDLSQPADTYPDMVPAIFPGPDGVFSIGVFDLVELAKHGAPKWQQNDIAELRCVSPSQRLAKQRRRS
jgi:hypothetical protein